MNPKENNESKKNDDRPGMVLYAPASVDLRFKMARQIFVQEIVKQFKQWFGKDGVEEEDVQTFQHHLTNFITSGKSVYLCVDTFYVHAEIDYEKSEKEIYSILQGNEQKGTPSVAATSIPPPVISKLCNYCRTRLSKAKVCSECRIAQYCNEECQRADWKLHHKQTCKRLTAPKSARLAFKRLRAAFANHCLTNPFMVRLVRTFHSCYCTPKTCISVAYKFKREEEEKTATTETQLGTFLNQAFLHLAVKLREVNITEEETKLLHACQLKNPMFATVSAEDDNMPAHWKNRDRVYFEVSEIGSNQRVAGYMGCR
jgi:hypothetical protein